MRGAPAAPPTAGVPAPVILLLTSIAGSVDAITFLSARVFTANMTGNTALLGIHLGLGDATAVLHSLAALGSYGLGVALGVVLTAGGRDPMRLRSAVLGAVLAETAALAAFTAIHLGAAAPGRLAPTLALVGCSGLAMGIQSAAVMRLQLPGMMTTYITGTVTTLVFTVVGRALAGRARPRPAATADGFERRALLQFLVFATYALAALASAGLQPHWPAAVALAPLLAATAVAAAIWRLPALAAAT